MNLESLKLNRQQITGIVAKNSISFIEAIFNCYRNNETVVLLRHSNDPRIQQTGVNRVIDPDDRKGWIKQSLSLKNDDAVAQISFTSGTEGEPKGVLLSFRAIADVVHRLNHAMEINESIKEYVGIPAHYSFGLGRFRAVSAVGGASFLPEHGFDPLEIRQMLASGEINAVSAVPSLWRVLLKNKDIFNDEANLLKWIEIGSQYMSQREKEELKALFPNAIIVQHYGLTEASRTTFLRVDQVDGSLLESVGKAYGETEIKLSESGRICIRGPHVAQILIKNAQFCSNVNQEEWFETQDLGRIEDNYLYYCGRADDLINCGGIKLSPDALEREIKEHLAVKDGIAVSAIDDEVTGHGVLVAYLKDINLSESLLYDVVLSVLREYGINNKRAIKLLELVDFPVTDTNKVKRKDLAEFFLSKLNESSEINKIQSVDKKVDANAEEMKILHIWKEILQADDIDIDSNFYELGGDSISAISALIEMERKGVPPEISKGMLQGLTVKEIAARCKAEGGALLNQHQIRSSAIHYNMVINNIRGLMVLFVILAHWHQGFVERLPFSTPEIITHIFAPLFAMGTPGFAIVYGVGAGFSLFPIYSTDPHRLKSVLKKTTGLLATGIFLLGLVVFLNKLLNSQSVSFTDFTNSFYTVLTYYLLISATLYFWIRLIVTKSNPVAYSILLSLVCYSFHVFWVSRFGIYKAEGLIEYIKLIFTAKYSYFLMLSGTLLGISIGLQVNKLCIQKNDLRTLRVYGAIILILGLIISIHMNVFNEWMMWPVKNNYIWRWISYAGVIILLLVWFDEILKGYNSFGSARKNVFQILSIIGMLAFPLFVLHEMVMPIKSIMISFGATSLISLVIPLLIFLLVSFLMYKKLHRFAYT